MNNSRQAFGVTIADELSDGITSSGAAGGTTYGAGCDYWEAWPLACMQSFQRPCRIGSTRDEYVLLYLPVLPPPSNSTGLYARSLARRCTFCATRRPLRVSFPETQTKPACLAERGQCDDRCVHHLGVGLCEEAG